MPTPQPLSIGLSGPLFAMSGTLSELNLFNLIQGSANFAIQVNQDVSVTIPVTGGTTTTLSGATLFQLGLGHISASVGAGGFGLNVTAGNLGIAVVEPPAPASGTDSRYWIGVDANSLKANLALGGVTASVQSLNLDLNQAGGVDPNNVAAIALDWMQPIKAADGTTITVDPGQDLTPSVSLAINYSQGPVFSIGATAAAVNIFNIITGSADFALSRSTTNVSFTGAAPASLMGASLIQVALYNLNLNIGVSGFGLSITGGDIGVVAVRAPTPAAGSDSRYWVAVDATNLTVGLSLGNSSSPGSSFTAEVTNLSIQINQAGGSYANGATTLAATPLDWTKDLDLAGDGQYGTSADQLNPATLLQLPTGTTPPNLQITFTGAEFAISGSLAQIKLFNLISGSADFAVSVSTTNVAFSGLGKPDLTGATLITLALSNLNIAVGATGFGLEITGGELGIAAIEAPTPQSGTDSRYWIAVDGMNLAASLAIGSSITATVSSLSIQLNQAGGTSSASGAATPLDWADDLDLAGNGTYGSLVNPGANLPTPINLSIAYTGGLFSVSGDLASLNIFNLITGSAAVRDQRVDDQRFVQRVRDSRPDERYAVDARAQ